MLWAKSTMGVDGKVIYIKWKVCSVIERRNKLLVPKLDFLWKHVGRRKAIIASIGVVVGDFYYLKSNQHVFNEKTLCAKWHGFYLITSYWRGWWRRGKLVQFAFIFHLISQSRPMIEYVQMQSLFTFFKVLKYPSKH